MISIRTLCALAAFAFAAPAQAQTDEQALSIVLVHGAFVDGSGWRKVHDSLTRDGYEVLVVQNPTVTLESDVAETRSAIAEAKHPVILVGHSYGGAVITEAGNDPRVKALVYIAAYAPDKGESVKSLKGLLPPERLAGAAMAPTLPPKDGFVLLDKFKMPASFAGDLDAGEGKFLADSQVRWGVNALGGVVTQAAWRSKPSYYLLASEDRMIPPVLQRTMAERAKSEIREERSSHAVMLSHPGTVVSVIEAAAAKAGH